jgi:ABC-type branched-subunit amino acid transport system substrate-binding protein
MIRMLLPARDLALAAGLALLAAACAPTTTSGPAPGLPQNAPSQQPAVTPSGPAIVALLAPLSAADEGAVNAGQALVNAAKMAETDIADPSLQLRIYDTTGDPGRARAAAQQAVTDGARLILGPLFSASTPGVGDVAASAGINVISFSTDSKVAGGPVFVSGFLPEAEAARIVGFAASRGYDRIGVFHPMTEYGAAALRGADEGALSTGARVVVAQAYERSFQGIQDAAGPFAQAAQGAGASAILMPESGQGLRSVAAFMDYAGLAPSIVRYLGLGQWNASATLQEPALQGGWFPAPDPNRLDRFAGLYAARYGTRPPFIAVLGYDAVQVAGQLLSEARVSRQGDPFGRSALTRPEGFQGALGPLRFEQDGRNRRAMAILEVGPRGFAVIDPAPLRLDLGS